VTRLWALALSVSLLLLACKEPPSSSHVPLSERASTRTLEQIPSRPVTGSIRGAAFVMAQARVRVVTMPGRERTDVLLSDVPIERCCLPLATGGRRVWLRIPGARKLDGSPLRAELGETATVSVHYELRVGGQWLGHEGGAALFSLRAAGFGKYEGALWTCFDDAQKSCVSGRFTASECRSELDVDDNVWGAARLDSKYPDKLPR
jgi:hypothetical protein